MIWVTHIEHATHLEICNQSPLLFALFSVFALQCRSTKSCHKRLYSSWWRKWNSQSHGSPVKWFCWVSKKLRLAVTSLKYISRLLCSIVHTLFFSKPGMCGTGTSCKDVLGMSHWSNRPRVDQSTRSQNFVIEKCWTYVLSTLTWAKTSLMTSKSSAIFSISSSFRHCARSDAAAACATVSAHKTGIARWYATKKFPCEPNEPVAKQMDWNVDREHVFCFCIASIYSTSDLMFYTPESYTFVLSQHSQTYVCLDYKDIIWILYI